MKENSSLGTSEPAEGVEAVCIEDHKRGRYPGSFRVAKMSHTFIREAYQLPELQNLVNGLQNKDKYGKVFLQQAL